MKRLFLIKGGRLTGFAAFIYLLNSCVPAYIPNTVNTPLFTGKHELVANVGTGLSGWDPQVAFSVTNHIGIMINSSFANRTSDTANFHRHAFVEGGVGYFINPVGPLVLEAYGGFGAGKVESYYDNNNWHRTTNANLRRFFFQPSIGVTNKVVDLSFTPRLVFVNVDMVESDFNTGYYYGYRPFVEPTFTFKVGYKYVKFFTQFGFSIPLATGDNYSYESEPFLFTMGMHFTFGRKYKL
jgi:hypothetical protein